MNVTLYVRTGCEICESAENQLINLLRNEKRIKYKIIKLPNDNSSNVQIVPALFVEDELYAYGELNEIKFKKLLKPDSI